MKIKKKFAIYVSQNMLGQIGISCYILADTFFISRAMGANGVTALNLVLPVYNFIFALGNMVGIGAAIRFAIGKNTKNKGNNEWLMNALFWGTLIGLVFSVIGFFDPDMVLSLLGADEEIIHVGTSYTRIFMVFAPCFIWNIVINAFVRNDGNPTLAMAGTIGSNLFNIVFDYILMFPCGMGMAGAALATALSPLVGIALCSIHFFSKKNTLQLCRIRPSVKKLFHSCQVGVSAFVSQMSSGIVVMLFNFLILGLAGNVGVAAYGVVANVSMVVLALFTGIAQGTQPLLSEAYGKNDGDAVKTLRNLGIGTAIVTATVVYLFIWFQADSLAGIFNPEQNRQLEELAVEGLKLYFIGFFFAGINVFCGDFFSAIGQAKWAFFESISRGFVSIIVLAFLLSALFGLTGVWLAFPAAELVTFMITVLGLVKIRNSYGKN